MKKNLVPFTLLLVVAVMFGFTSVNDKNAVSTTTKIGLEIGDEAPNIIMKDVDGKELKLSSLKGKMVLIDFWASWCGPCRRENPNVVSAYNKYSKAKFKTAKGFEIFSVSFDQNKTAWEEAIAKDGLLWKNHVCDMKGWANAAGQLYGISSIPSSVLIDENGIIVAKNLRGPALDMELDKYVAEDVFNVGNDTYSTQKQNGNNVTEGNKAKNPVVDNNKKIEPPILTIDQNSVRFKDFDLNNRIDGKEECSISFDIENEGKGFAMNLSAAITESNNVGITTTTNYSIGKVEPKSKRSVTIPFTGSLGLKSGVAKIQINFKEQNGFQPDPILIDIPTHEFEKPEIKVVDYSFLTDNGLLKLGYPIQLKVIIQNMGQGDAEAVSVDFRCPELNVFRNSESHFKYESLKSGESVEVVFEFVANKLYTPPTVPIKIQLGEKYNLYAKNKDVAATIDSQSSGGTISIVSNAKSAPKIITEVSLRSDADKDIPVGLLLNKKKYALIIGNEDYSKYQTSLDKEVNVDFASNDARVFAEYCEKTLGYPKENIMVIVDATRGQMSQKLAQLVRFAEVENGEAELLFYYSGHGLPEEGTNIPYLIPVDVSGTQPSSGIALTFVYDELSKFPTKKSIVILDACFSGGARNKELVALKGVKVKAKVDAVPGNLVVLASSSGNEASAVYREKQHGYFTYFILKNLQMNKGQGNLESIISEVSQNVAREAARIGKNQTPNVLPGAEIGEGWKILGW